MNAQDVLQAVLLRLDRGDAPDSRWPDHKGEFWGLCPFHPDEHAKNFSVSERGYHCFACGAKGSLKALAKHLGIEVMNPPAVLSPALTLVQYASAKKLPVAFLQSLGVREVAGKYGPFLEMPYKDEKGRVVAVRRRFRMHDDGHGQRFAWQKGTCITLYGLWRLNEIHKAGWVLILEGESDCHTAWHHGLPALGVPGANTWKPAWAEYLKGLRVFVWAEPDEGGKALVQAINRTMPIEAMNPPDGLKDLSEAHCKGVDVPALVEEMKAKAGAMNPADVMNAASTLASLAPWVTEQLGVRSGRDTKLEVAKAIVHWLLSHKRLFLDVGQDVKQGGRPYVLGDDGALWPLEPDNVATRKLLHEAGLNGAEAVYRFIAEEIVMAAYKAGQPVRLSHWQVGDGEALYVSCGPSALVRAKEGKLLRLPNGADAIWFAGDLAYPEWQPVEPVRPLSLPAFNPNLVAPDEVPAYSPAAQRVLLGTWLAALLSGLRPLPVLLAVGEKGGGKTRLACAIARMLMGPPPTGDVQPLSDDRRDWWAAVTSLPLVALDNVDSDVPAWFPDELARTVTGISVKTRQLYTDGERLDRPVTAAVAITTRTAAFARPDVAERSLPLLTQEFGDKERIIDSELMRQVDESRDGLMSWAALTAAELLRTCKGAPDALPLRFVDFAKLTWAYCKAHGQSEVATKALYALQQAQSLVVGEADPLVEAIVMHLDAIGTGGSWRGTASELVAALTAAGADLPFLGGGKAIARRLREAKATLRLAGIAMREENVMGRPFFTFQKRPAPSESSESSEFYKSVQLQQEPTTDCNREVLSDSDDSDDSDMDLVGLSDAERFWRDLADERRPQ